MSIMAQTQAKFKPSNSKAILFLLSWFSLCVGGILLSLYVWYWLGQILLGLAFLQAFILLHETGHYSFFKSKRVNILAGHFFGFLSLIPFISWVDIHRLHHRWTGWRDKDPTTTGTVNPEHSLFIRLLVNLCWLLFIPLFTIGYRIGNYWNFKKLEDFSSRTNRKKVFINLLFILIIWAALILIFPKIILVYVLPAFIIGLVFSDLVILSQHSHIHMPVSHGKDVSPLKYQDQVQYTRSIHLGRIIDHWLLFNFSMHEKHHAFPGVPAYYLSQKEYPVENTRNFLTYLWRAKTMTGESFVFKTTKDTGKIV